MQGLIPKQLKAIIVLLSARSIQEAAESLKINESTLWRWMKQPEFQKAYLEAKSQAVGQAISQIQNITGEAVATLRSVMNNELTPPGNRITAAKSVLEFALKGIEMESLEVRIQNIEERLKSLET